MFKNLFKNTVENSSVKNENQIFESENDIEKYNNRGHYNNNYKSNQQNQNPEKDNKNCYDGVDESNNGGKKVKKEPYYLKMSSIPADRQKHGLILDFSNEDNLILQHFEEAPFSNKGFLNRKAIRAHAAELIEKFDVRPRGCEEAPAGTLSGGNQQKVIIAREVTNDKDLLIAVNPTRGLDVGAIEFVHKYLVDQRNKNRAVLLVSFELDEIMSLSDRIEVIFDGRITGSVPGKNADEKELGYMMAGGRKDE